MFRQKVSGTRMTSQEILFILTENLQEQERIYLNLISNRNVDCSSYDKAIFDCVSRINSLKLKIRKTQNDINGVLSNSI